MAARLVLKPGRERSLVRRHPWIFSGAVAKVEGEAGPGDTVEVRSADGRFLARAGYSPASQIRARAWSFDPDAPPEDELFRGRIETALAMRRERLPQAGALRLVNAEADGLPGFIADRYGDTLVVQCLSAGAERWRETLVELLSALTGCTRVYERSDADARSLEGLARRADWVKGGGSTTLEIAERGVRYCVDIASGHKTGFYLDQRDNRRRIGELAGGREALDCFCYTGGFSLEALRAGATSVLSVDSSAGALRMARANAALNGLDDARAQWLEADVFRALRSLHAEGRRFDLVVLDPPKFAPTPKDAERAARGYKDINLNALKLLRRGGLLATFSCSGGISTELFRKIVAGAAADAQASLVVRESFSAAADHPVLLEFPEGEYLKGLLLERR